MRGEMQLDRVSGAAAKKWNKAAVHLLTIFFGLGSWICVVGVFTELPLFVQTLPEGWTLPSYFCLITTLANVGLVVVSLGQKFWPTIVTLKSAITTLLIVGNVSTFLLIFFWDRTVDIWGARRSLFLFGLCFLLALLDCTSRILFLPFIAQFHPTYIKSYFIGETLTGLLPSIFSLFQGIGTDGSTECISILANSNLTQRYEVKHLPPNIPVSMFMVFILSIMLLCSVSFALLNVKSIVKHARNATTSPPLNIVTSTDHEMTQEMKHSNSSTLLPNIQPRFVNFWSLLTLQCVNCLIYGSTDAILSYSTLPYGSVTFLLAVTLRYSASSLMCLINLFLPQPKSKIMLSVIGLFLSSVMYCFWTAATSPNPPLEGKLIGSVLIVCTAVTAAVTFTYIKVITALWLQSVGGYRGIFSFGIATQIGYGTAAVVMFLLVNTWELFVSKPDCPVKP